MVDNMLDWPAISTLKRMLNIEHLAPSAVSLGCGGLVGWVAARIIRQTGRTLGCLVAVIFVLMQILAYYGIVRWTWADLLDYAELLEEAAIITATRLRILTYNVPFTLGGLLGFLYGIRRP